MLLYDPLLLILIFVRIVRTNGYWIRKNTISNMSKYLNPNVLGNIFNFLFIVLCIKVYNVCCHSFQSNQKVISLFTCKKIPCHNCNIVSVPFTYVMSDKAVAYRYSQQSTRCRNSFVVGLAKRKHCIRHIYHYRCFCSCGNGPCINISLSPMK